MPMDLRVVRRGGDVHINEDMTEPIFHSYCTFTSVLSNATVS